MKTRLIFVRHAEAEGNFYRVFHGWTDSVLTEKGHIQAKKLGERMKSMDIDIIYSSTLKRTLQTAEYIARAKGLPIIRTDKLKEINGGDWENMPWEVLPEKWPDEYNTWENEPHLHQMPNGESMEELQCRIIKEVKHIASQNKGKNVCIVTHGTAIKAVMCIFRNCDFEEMVTIPWHDNTAVTIIDYEDDKFCIVLEGDTSHLNEEDSTIDKQKWWTEQKKKINGLRRDSR
jgi:broad specificity phosphatase PhoE